eukprot:TRINITY_DN13837_c0_g1_i1.p1 TRINITY_DN13837_c0_g1~~TRINITY_DN13837_c0_g1_i1.p1  ORF type:complete len:448 (+),score=62.21 TRINITY_DN13837_c0_g1_i1:109-1452(+)
MGNIGGRGRRGGAGSGAGARDARGAGYGAGQGRGSGAAAGGGAPAALAAICAIDPRHIPGRDVPVLPAPANTAAIGSGNGHIHLLTAQGEVFSMGENDEGQLGTGDHARRPRDGLRATRLPWPAAAVSCGWSFSVALCRGGAAVCSWGGAHRGQLGRDNIGCLPCMVQGLPSGDPVVLLEAGHGFAIAITRSGEAFGWGSNACQQLALGYKGSEAAHPVRIAALSGRGVRRLACGDVFFVAETSGGELLFGGSLNYRMVNDPQPLHVRPDAVAFPLRSLAAVESRTGGAVAAADAGGRLWCQFGRMLTPFGLPPEERVVRVAGCTCGEEVLMGMRQVRPVFVALTAWWHLWECSGPSTDICRRITSARAPPLGLLPWGGCVANRIVLIPDLSCGLRRCRLLLLAAGRRRLLPGGQMQRAALVPYLVAEDLIIEAPSAGRAADGMRSQ